jgi:hypothetical protein
MAAMFTLLGGGGGGGFAGYNPIIFKTNKFKKNCIKKEL